MISDRYPITVSDRVARVGSQLTVADSVSNNNEYTPLIRETIQKCPQRSKSKNLKGVKSKKWALGKIIKAQIRMLLDPVAMQFTSATLPVLSRCHQTARRIT